MFNKFLQIKLRCILDFVIYWQIFNKKFGDPILPLRNFRLFRRSTIEFIKVCLTKAFISSPLRRNTPCILIKFSINFGIDYILISRRNLLTCLITGPAWTLFTAHYLVNILDPYPAYLINFRFFIVTEISINTSAVFTILKIHGASNNHQNTNHHWQAAKSWSVMKLASTDSHYAKYTSNEPKNTSPQTHFTNKTPVKKLNILTRKQPSNFGIDHGIAHMLWIILAIAKAVHPVVHYIIICSLLIITFHLNIFDFLAEFAMRL